MNPDATYFYLPEKYWKIHDQCELIFSQIEGFITDDAYLELRINQFDLGTEFSLEENEHVLDFLLRINKLDEHDKIIKTTIVYGLLMDLCDSLQEAIACSKKRRLSVTFALLRKPFVYTLLVFLRLIFDDDFLEKFNTNDSFDATSIDENTKLNLLKMSLPLLIATRTANENELYDWIFNQNKPDSLINITNRAIHLSTTRNKNNKTGVQNLNFIFLNQENIESLWDYLYHRLPFLLLYLTEILDVLVFNLIEIPEGKLNQRLEDRIRILNK